MAVLQIFVYEIRLNLFGLLASVKLAVVFVMQFPTMFTKWQIAYTTHLNTEKLTFLAGKSAFVCVPL